MPLMSPATWQRIKDIRTEGLTELHAEWHISAYTCWTVNRDAGWADGTSVEAQAVVETGTGRLYANGAGRPQTAEMVVALESGYRLRTATSELITSGHLLTIGTRRFRVDDVKRESEDDPLMDVYLTELFQTPMPTAPAPPEVP